MVSSRVTPAVLTNRKNTYIIRCSSVCVTWCSSRTSLPRTAVSPPWQQWLTTAWTLSLPCWTRMVSPPLNFSSCTQSVHCHPVPRSHQVAHATLAPHPLPFTPNSALDVAPPHMVMAVAHQYVQLGASLAILAGSSTI